METQPRPIEAPEKLHEVLDIQRLTPVHAGHMLYNKCLVETPNAKYFVKTSDDSLLTDPYQARKMWEYLIKEQYAYDIVRENGFHHIPEATMHHHSLILEAHLPEDGWLWNVPAANPKPYIEDVMGALVDLENINGSDELTMVDPDGSAQLLLRKGWGTISKEQIGRIRQNLEANIAQLHPHVVRGTEVLDSFLNLQSIECLYTELYRYVDQPVSSIAHFDARQSNIAWHSKHGVRIVDWSWASAGSKGSDTTMFLIDLHKSNIDITYYMKQYFDPDHALLQIGYWLARCIEPSPSTDNTVRFHQLASAVSAADLLVSY